jgi:predicted acyl esterase
LKLSKRILSNRLSLLAGLLALLTAALAAPQPAARAVCPDAGTVRYYSDATYTVQVGSCSHACCKTWTCTGQLTQYSIAHMVSCDFN